MRSARMLVLLLLTLAAAESSGAQQSPFAIRGIKGLWWEGIEKYRLAVPWLAEHKLNFLMLCYSSFPASGSDWRADYTPKEQSELRDLARDAEKRGITLCLSFNPGIWSKPPLSYSSEADYQLALRKVKLVHSLGIRWFGLCLDDINRGLLPEDKAKYGTLQAAQVAFTNRLWRDLQPLDPKTRLIFCPSAYTTEDAEHHQDYITAIGAGLDPAIMVFWTGPQVCSPTITAADARKFAGWIRRKPFVWDNYPVNDMFPWRPLLAPVKGRAPDLAGEVAGFMSNPMKQWYASTIPLSTVADYLNDPANYDTAAEKDRVLSHYTPEERSALEWLMMCFGNSFLGEADYPPKPRAPDREHAGALLTLYDLAAKSVSSQPGLRGLWEDVKPTVQNDVSFLKRKDRLALVLGPHRAEKIEGDELQGGAGEVYGFQKYDRNVNYVYAQSTGKSEMHLDFLTSSRPAGGLLIKVTARDDDSGRKVKIRIRVNDTAVVEGKSPFNAQAFTTHELQVPAAAVRQGLNRLSIENLEPQGPLGNPPWFMVAEVAISASSR